MHQEPHHILIGIVGFASLLFLLSIVKHYTRKSIMPADAWVLIAGIIYGSILKHWDIDLLPKFELSPEIIILIFLPVLIFASGRLVNLHILKSESAPIGFFAIIGVLATNFIIGYPVATVLDIPLIHGLLIGAAAGATDPAAVGAIFHSFNIPKRLGIVVEGESLFNDGTTVVLFSLISSLAISNSVFNLQSSLLFFTWAVFAAIPLGMLLGWTGARLLDKWRENNIFFEISMTIIITYAAFLIGEKLLHVSGVISVLMAAIVFFKIRNSNAKQNNYLDKLGKDQKTLSEFWEYISIIINGILFFSLGAATGLHDFSEVPTIAVAVSVLSLILARAILIYGGCTLFKVFNKTFSFAWQNILFLGGLRGAVSAALILLIPHDYEHRGTFVCLAFAMIAFTLIVQPTIMKAYLKRQTL